MSEWAAKRFWKEVATDASAEGYRVLLDGRALATPLKTPFRVPTEALAQKIATEWRAQAEEIDPLSMPYSRIANSAIDKVGAQRQEVVAHLAAYGETDLLCYRADGPDILVARQAEAWDPLLAWSKDVLGAPLIVTSGILSVEQPIESVERLKAAVDAQSNFQLAAFHDLVALSGSLILALAVVRKLRDPDSLWALSRVDEDWQSEQWGADEEATEVVERRKIEFLRAADFYELTS